MHDPVEGVVDRAMPVGQRWGAPQASELGVHLLMPGHCREPKARRETRIGSMLPSIGSERLGRAPEPRAEAADVLGLGLIPWPDGSRERTQWV